MLICERAQIAFTQIPKNGTKSVCSALNASFGIDHSHIAADLGWSEDRYRHVYDNGPHYFLDALGKNNLVHLPLQAWREHFPQTFAAFCSAHSFALVRRPRERFISAVMQRLGEVRGKQAVRVDDPIVCEEAVTVCAWLDQRGPFNDQPFIHFNRQIDYIDLDGERIVDAVFSIRHTHDAEAWIESKTGTQITIKREHVRREPKPAAKLLNPALRVIGRRLVPQSIRETVYPHWRNSKLFQSAFQRYDAVDLGAEVESFIAQHYAADFILYDEVEARGNQVIVAHDQ